MRAISTSSGGAAAAIWSRSFGMTGSGCRWCAKRMDRSKFIWPSASAGAVSISAEQMAYMVDSAFVAQLFGTQGDST